MLPAYAIDRSAPRRGVRCLTDTRLVDGGPRDIYTDPLMLEAQVRWLDALLAGFAGHPAINSWELGHDPATTIRPVRIADMVSWAALLAERVHAQEERCRISIGQGDIVRGRGVQLAGMAEHVDELGLVLRPQRLPLPGNPLEPGRAVFVVELAQALAGAAAPLLVELGIASGDGTDAIATESGVVDDVTAPGDIAQRSCDEMLQRLVGAGVAGVHASAWSDWGGRLLEAPPGDRRAWLARQGIVDSAGISKPVADAWDAVVTPERGVDGELSVSGDDRRRVVLQQPARTRCWTCMHRGKAIRRTGLLFSTERRHGTGSAACGHALGRVDRRSPALTRGIPTRGRSARACRGVRCQFESGRTTSARWPYQDDQSRPRLRLCPR